MAKNVDAERRACEIRLRAERKAGKLLATTEENPGDHRSHGATDDLRTLSDLGVSKSQSSKWQQLAAVTEAEFEDQKRQILSG